MNIKEAGRKSIDRPQSQRKSFLKSSKSQERVESWKMQKGKTSATKHLKGARKRRNWGVAIQQV